MKAPIKINREIQELKEDLRKENDVLRRAVSKYVIAAYDTEWLYSEAKKLEEELNRRIVESD